MVDNIYKQEGKDRVIAGIRKVVDFIKPSYGPGGGNIILEEDFYPFHSVRNDGKAIVDKIKLADPIENIGLSIIKEAGDRADKESGDGRKTTMLLVDAIFEEAKNHKDIFPMDLKRSLDECIPIIFESIDSQKKAITVDEVGKIATLSSENEMIGQLVQEIYQQVGKDGIIELDNSNTFDTFYEVKEGVRFRKARYISPDMATDDEKNRAIYKKPPILVTKQKIGTISDLNIFEKLEAEGIKECVIFCDDIDPGVATALVHTSKKAIFKSLVIKAPTLWKDWVFEDFAKLTGATIVSPESGVTLSNVEISHLGSCETLIVDRNETRVIGGQDITDHIKKLELASVDDEQLKLRLSWLQTKVAILKVGGNSESELSHILKKAKDATSASYLALKDGVVRGGGMALNEATTKLPDTVGGKILKVALLAPLKQIKENMNLADDYFPDEEVLDPALVIKNAVRNAISIAGTNLTAKGVIITPR
jgi:chaperonin GroEL